MGFYSGGRDWAQLQIQYGQEGIYSQGAGCGSVDLQLLRRSNRGRGESGQIAPTESLLKPGQDDHTSPGIEDEELNQKNKDTGFWLN